MAGSRFGFPQVDMASNGRTRQRARTNRLTLAASQIADPSLCRRHQLLDEDVLAEGHPSEDSVFESRRGGRLGEPLGTSYNKLTESEGDT